MENLVILEHDENATAETVDPGKVGLTAEEVWRPTLEEWEMGVKVLGKLGSGGFAWVMKVTHEGRTKALKIMRQGLENPAAAAYMFFKEARTTRKCMGDSHIVQLDRLVKIPKDADAIPDSGLGCCWAMLLEYMEGGSMAQLIMKQMASPHKKVYSNVQAIMWLLDVAQGLNSLHSKSPCIVHRDVKTDNILLCDDKGRLMAKVTDLGLHKSLDTSLKPILRVRTNSVAGSITSTSIPLPSDPPSPTGPRPAATHASPLSSSAANQVMKSGLSSAGRQALGRSRMSTELGDKSSRATSTPQLELSPRLPSATAPSSPRQIKPGSRASQNNKLLATILTHNLEKKRTAAVAAASSDTPVSEESPCLPLAPHSPASPPGSADISEEGKTLPPPASTKPQNLGPAAPGSPTIFLNFDDEADSPDALAAGLPAQLEQLLHSNQSQYSVLLDVVQGGQHEDLLDKELGLVYNITGQTGSCFYMSPEVYKQEPYNEKSDVFSFGVVMYELFSRTLLVMVHTATGCNVEYHMENYIKHVSEGWRPERCKLIPACLWDLIQSCWDQDPVARPDMEEVIEALRDVQRECNWLPHGDGQSSTRSTPLHLSDQLGKSCCTIG